LQNASSTSENDAFAIPETQADEIDISLQRPEIPIINNEQIKLPAMNLNNFSSSLSTNKSNENEVSSSSTQISVSHMKEDRENSMNNTKTHNTISANKCTNDSDENIYEMETQRPFDLNEIENDIENIETQPFSLDKSDLDKRKSNDSTIYNTKTQKIDFTASVNDSITNLETQQLQIKSDFSQKTQNDLSIYSAATQKLIPEISSNISIENLETELLNCKASDYNTTKSQNMSNSSAEMNKIGSKVSTLNIETFETQKFNCNTVDSDQEKLNNEHELSIYTAKTQRIEPETVINNHLNNIETEKLHNAKYDKVATSNLLKIKSNYKSLDKASNTIDEYLDVKTHPTDDKNFSSARRKTDNTLFYNDTIHKTSSTVLFDKSVENCDKFDKTEKNSPDEKVSELKHNVEINCLEDTKLDHLSVCTNNKSIQNIESENFINENSKTISNMKFSLGENEKVHNINKKKGLDNDNQEYDISDPKHISFDSGFRTTEQESDDHNKSNSMKSDDNETSKSQNFRELLLNSSLCQVNTSMNLNNFNETNDLQNHDKNQLENESLSSIDKHFNKSKSILNEDEEKYTLDNDDDEDEMFSSQNLLQDCPFAFLPEESEINDQSNSEPENIKMKVHENESSTGKTFDASININNKSINKDGEELQQENQSTFKIRDNLSTSNNHLLNPFSKIDTKKKLSKTDEESAFYKEQKIDEFNTNVNQNVIESDSETDEEGIYSSYLSTNINKNSSKIYDQSNSGNNKGETFKKHTNIQSECDLISSKKQNNLIHESSTTDSENSMFDDCDNENKCVNQAVQNSLHIYNLKQNASEIKEDMNSLSDEVMNVSKLSNVHKGNKSTIENVISIEPVDIPKSSNTLISSTNNENRNQLPLMQDMTAQESPIIKDSDNDFIISMSVTEKQENLNEKKADELKDIKLKSSQEITTNDFLSSKVIDKQFSDKSTEINKNDSFGSVTHQVIEKIVPKESFNYSKQQLEKSEMKYSKSCKSTGNNKCSNINTNDSIERNLDEMFDGYQTKTIEQESSLLTQQLTDILECSQIENSSNIDLNLSTLSPTLGTRKNNLKIKNRRKTMFSEKAHNTSQTRKTLSNLNDTLERNLNEIFNDSVNTVESLESDGMLTQQLKSVLQSQDDSQSNNEETIKKKSSLSLSLNSEKKYRLSLSMNLNNSMSSQDEVKKEKSVKSDEQFKLDLDKQETTLQESNLNNDSQDTEIYFANLKSKRKNKFMINSQTESESKNSQLLSDNDKEIVKKQRNACFSSIDKVENIKESAMSTEWKSNNFTNSNQPYDNSFDKLQIVDSPKVYRKKRISLSLSKNLNLNLSQMSQNDQEVERKISTKQQDHKSAIRTNVDNNLESHPSSLDKVCTPYNINLSISEIASTDDCSNSDDDFLKSMPEIKVAGTVGCPATHSQLIAPSDDDYGDEETTPIHISPTDIVIPTKWNWYAKKRYDLIYRKDHTDVKLDNSNAVHIGSPTTKTQVSDIDKILARIESTGKRHTFKNSRRSNVSNEDKNICSTRSRRVRKMSSIEVFPNRNSYNSDSSSDVDSDSILERIIPKYKALEPIKIDAMRDTFDDSDEEFQLLRKNCEKMLAAPSVYNNISTRNKNLKKIKTRHTNVMTLCTEKGNRGSLKTMCNYIDDDVHSLGEISNKDRTVDEDALVFQMSRGASKDYTNTRMSNVDSTQNKKLLKTKADNDSHNQSAKLMTRNRGKANVQQALKFQEVLVLISPLKENVISRFNAERSTKINDNIKSNFKQTVDIVTTRPKRLLKSRKRLDNSVGAIKRSGSEIENEAESITTRNQRVLKNKRAKLDTQIEHNKNSSKENVCVDDWNVDSTSCQLNVRITRLQKNKATNLSTSAKNNSNDETPNNNIVNHNLRATRSRTIQQNRNKNEPLQKVSNLKRKDIIIQESDYETSNELGRVTKDSINNHINDMQDSKKYEKLKNIAIKGTKGSKDKQKQNVDDSNVENVEIINRHRTSNTKVKDSNDSHLNKIENKKSLRIKNAIIKKTQNLDSNKMEISSPARTRSKRIKDIDDIQNETKDKSDGNYNIFSNSPFSNNSDIKEKKLVAENTSKNSYSMRTRKRIVNSSEESQEVADILQNINDRVSKSNKSSNSENNTSNSNFVAEESVKLLKRRRPNKSVESKSIHQYSEGSNDLLHASSLSENRNASTSSQLPASRLSSSLKTRRSLSRSYQILLTGDKSKTYSEAVTKIGMFLLFFIIYLLLF
jgi:hypothetical protein